MSEGEEFDAGGAAARAMGDVADVGEDVAEIVDGDDGGAPDGGGSDPTPASGDAGGSTSSSGVVPGGVKGAVRSLFLAPERGPTQSTFSEAGVDDGGALALDGTTDWLLDVVGVDAVGDTLGPVGKVALGLSQRQDDGADRGGADQADDGGGGADESVDDGGGSPEGPAPPEGVSGA